MSDDEERVTMPFKFVTDVCEQPKSQVTDYSRMGRLTSRIPQASTPAFRTRTRPSTAGRTTSTTTSASSPRVRTSSHAASSSSPTVPCARVPGSVRQEEMYRLGAMGTLATIIFHPPFFGVYDVSDKYAGTPDDPAANTPSSRTYTDTPLRPYVETLLPSRESLEPAATPHRPSDPSRSSSSSSSSSSPSSSYPQPEILPHSLHQHPRLSPGPVEQLFVPPAPAPRSRRNASGGNSRRGGLQGGGRSAPRGAWWEGVGEWIGAVDGVRGHGGVGRVGGGGGGGDENDDGMGWPGRGVTAAEGLGGVVVGVCFASIPCLWVGSGMCAVEGVLLCVLPLVPCRMMASRRWLRSSTGEYVNPVEPVAPDNVLFTEEGAFGLDASDVALVGESSTPYLSSSPPSSSASITSSSSSSSSSSFSSSSDLPDSLSLSSFDVALVNSEGGLA
ncbi:hypothetical protein KC363_g69 [Hortaea werneckii]|nr:hypothetical protein KC363_g69 [Hortaea werneckii]